MMMCEQLHVMNLLLDQVTICIVHYSVFVIVVVLIESGVMFRHMH